MPIDGYHRKFASTKKRIDSPGSCYRMAWMMQRRCPMPAESLQSVQTMKQRLRRPTSAGSLACSSPCEMMSDRNLGLARQFHDVLKAPMVGREHSCC